MRWRQGNFTSTRALRTDRLYRLQYKVTSALIVSAVDNRTGNKTKSSRVQLLHFNAVKPYIRLVLYGKVLRSWIVCSTKARVRHKRIPTHAINRHHCWKIVKIKFNIENVCFRFVSQSRSTRGLMMQPTESTKYVPTGELIITIDRKRIHVSNASPHALRVSWAYYIGGARGADAKSPKRVSLVLRKRFQATNTQILLSQTYRIPHASRSNPEARRLKRLQQLPGGFPGWPNRPCARRKIVKEIITITRKSSCTEMHVAGAPITADGLFFRPMGQ